MKVSKEVKELLKTIPEMMLVLAKDAVNFSANLTEAAVSLSEEVSKMEVDE